MISIDFMHNYTLANLQFIDNLEETKKIVIICNKY